MCLAVMGDESGESSERRWLGDAAGEKRSVMRGWWWIKGLSSGVVVVMYSDNW